MTFATKRRGFTLVEMVLVLTALVVLMGMMAASLIGALRTQEQATRTSNRQFRLTAMADAFRADVSQAVDAPDGFDETDATPECLVLRMKDGSHVVYSWQDHKLTRILVTKKGQTPRPQPVGDNRVAIEFVRSKVDRTVTLKFTEPRGKSATKSLLEVTAAIGGDLR